MKRRAGDKVSRSGTTEKRNSKTEPRQSPAAPPGYADRISAAGTARSTDGAPAADGEKLVVPVVAEELKVGRRVVETGKVRLSKVVREDEQVVDEPVLTEEVEVERVPVGKFVDAPPQPRQEGDTVVFPVLEEVLVVERKLRLKEEIRVRKRVTETHEPQTVTLRKEEIKIDRISDGSA